MLRKLLKTWFHSDNPMLAEACRGLNELGLWANAFSATPPLVATPTMDGVHLTWQPWESPFVHPWMVRPSATTSGKIDVRGGRVHDGSAPHDVTGLTDVTAGTATKIWLKVVHYYSTGTASEFILESGTAWPSSTHTSTAQTTYIRVAEIVTTTLRQYLYEDQFVPRVMPPVHASGTYYLRTVNGVMAWVQSGSCSA